MLKVDKIKVFYDKALILKEVSLEAGHGEIIALIGPNGAGKTTTLKTIAGLLKTSSGAIYLENKRIDHEPPYVRASMGIILVPEGRGLFPKMSVEENLEMGAFLRKDVDEIRKDMEFVYSLFPVLRERRRQLAGTLSGGEQQMLAIAKGLMARPRILMLDEPSLGLAPKIVDHLIDAISQINREKKITILIAEQNVYAALSISERAYVLENGSIVMSGSSLELLENPVIKRSYLGL
ncbi:MAG: ATP-binding cassette domain-containing protein [Desulfurococcales archaeon]|nr:ATP-binding cassette domain-containing protein [Desulfurococcales archaeon]